ncbi:MAG TPA: glycine zipper 2TM domain-containing protein [Croceibacterium sp.]|nr:glycine zipper 2TM domain-containing protein [Croceibacterium sp.]
MKSLFRTSALALAAAGIAVSAVPAAAQVYYGHRSSGYEQSWNHNRDGRDRYGYDTRYYGRNYHSQMAYRGQSWRVDDGRYYCRKKDGTTGLIIGAAAGALLGHEVDGGYHHTLGTVIGGALGALLGKSVAQSNSCR